MAEAAGDIDPDGLLPMPKIGESEHRRNNVAKLATGAAKRCIHCNKQVVLMQTFYRASGIVRTTGQVSYVHVENDRMFGRRRCYGYPDETEAEVK